MPGFLELENLEVSGGCGRREAFGGRAYIVHRQTGQDWVASGGNRNDQRQSVKTKNKNSTSVRRQHREDRVDRIQNTEYSSQFTVTVVSCPLPAARCLLGMYPPPPAESVFRNMVCLDTLPCLPFPPFPPSPPPSPVCESAGQFKFIELHTSAPHL